MKRRFKAIYRSLPFKKTFFSLIRWLPINESVYRHLHFVGVFTITVLRGRKFKIMHWGHQVENDLFWAGYANGWESSSLRLWAKIAQKSDLILDIGANTGVYALAAQAVNQNAKVWAFEPVKRIYEKLSVNLGLNQNQIEPFNLAISDSSGYAVIYDVETDHSYSASLNSNMLKDSGLQKTETEIKKTTLDEFILGKAVSKGSNLLIKIDVEMHELEAVKGMKLTIDQHRPMLIIEILNKELGESVSNEFKDKKYTFYEINEAVGLKESKFLGEKDRNYFICPDEKVSSLGFCSNITHKELL